MNYLKTITIFLSGVLLAGQSMAAQPPLLLKHAVGPLLSKPGEYFSVVESTHKSSDMEAKRRMYIKNMLGGESGYAHQIKRLNYSTKDQLAEEYMRSFDGYITTAASLSFFSAMLESKGIHAPPKIMNDFMLANGKHMLLPAQDANIMYGWTMSEIDKINAKSKPVSVAGRYRMVMQGNCPFGDGDVEIVQTGSVIEGRQHDNLLFWGRVGEKSMFIQFAEIKYYEVYGPKEHATDNYPSRPSDVYRAAIDTKRLEFTGMYFNVCKPVMRRVK